MTITIDSIVEGISRRNDKEALVELLIIRNRLDAEIHKLQQKLGIYNGSD